MKTRLHLNVFLALLASVCVALAGAGCGSDGGGGDSDEAQALLKKAFATQVDSADLKVAIKADLEGDKSLEDPLTLTLTGPVKSNGETDLPELDWDVAFEGGGQKLSGGLVFTKENAFVQFQGQAYEVGREITDQARKSLKAGRKDGDKKQTTFQDLGIEPADWLEDAEVEDGDDIGGDSTQRVTGDVDVGKVVRDVLGAAKSPAVRRQLEATGQTVPEVPEASDEDVKKVEDAIKDAKLEVNVDDQDRVRRMLLEVEFDVPEDSRAGEVEGGKLSFDYTVERVGVDPEIKAPANARPLQELLGGFLGGLGGAGGLQTTPRQ